MTEWTQENKEDWDHHDQVINVSILFFSSHLSIFVQQIIKLLKKHPEQKLKSDLHEIANHIKELTFFKDQGIEGVDMHEMCGNMTYQFCEKDDVIYNFN